MLLKFEINTKDRNEIEEAIYILRGLQPVDKPIIEKVAEEKNLNPDILAAGVQAALGQFSESSVSDVNEAPTPPPVAPPVAPAAPAPKPTPQAQGVELDNEGLPWDSRIHASSRKKLAKTGTWKLVRGADPAVVEQVKTELRGVMAIPAPTTVTENVQPVETPTPPPVAPPVAPAAPEPEPTPQVQANVTFPELITAVTEAGLAESEVSEACKKFGIDAIFTLAARPDLVPHVYNELFE